MSPDGAPPAEAASAPAESTPLVQSASLKGGLTFNLSAGAYDSRAGKPMAAASAGTSIFDPVLAELLLRWFSPPGGLVLDPFAGGSVRGVVTAMLGRRYLGIDLSEAQIEANREQWAEISAKTAPPPSSASGRKTVKVSAAMARLPFHGCDQTYIRDVCHASCCQSATHPSGIRVAIHPSEEQAIKERGGVVVAGMLQPIDKRCPFKVKEAELCSLHFTADKPFGCVASPFTLNRNGTLIVRNRYKMLKCYDDGPRLPAYVAFRASLDLIFGKDEAERICAHLQAGGGDLLAEMDEATYSRLADNAATRRGERATDPDDAGPQWIVGDSRDLSVLVGEADADFILTCPPYADLEIYSSDPRDISNMQFDQFMAALSEIIAQACARLRPDRFAAMVIGDVRDKAGLYRGLPWRVVQAFEAAGLRLYNEAVLITACGSLAMRAAEAFVKSRKLGRAHQSVLVFCKGDPTRATEAIGPVEFGELTDEGEAGETGPIGGEI
jgi:hypothetical protein